MSNSDATHSMLNVISAELELEFYYQNASTADATVDVPIANTITKQQLQLIASWLDLASILLYLVIVLFIILYQQRVLEEVSAKTVTVTDYSVQVWDLPKVGTLLSLLFWVLLVPSCQTLLQKLSH